MADISKIQTLDGTTYDIKDNIARQNIPFGVTDSTSTSTIYTATVPGITALANGTICYIMNNEVTSKENCTININNLGAKPLYMTNTTTTRVTTQFATGYTWMLVYNTTRVDNGCWDLIYLFNTNTNTIGYQLRTNSTVMKTFDQSRYYRLFFTSADGTHWVPANTAKDNSATSAKTVNQRPIDPFGRIIYYGASTNLSAESDVSASYCWDQYTFSLGYSFNMNGAALTLTIKTPVYIKCTPQSDGSAIIDSTTPYVQSLPSSEDGKIYIFLGVAYSATNVELVQCHPIYYYKDGAIRLWTNQTNSGGTLDYGDLTNKPSINNVTLSGNKTAAELGLGTYSKPSGGIPASDLASAVQTSLGLADSALQSVPSTYRTAAAQDVIDASKQATLVSEQNIKTVNGQTILGSGDLVITGTLPTGGTSGQ